MTSLRRNPRGISDSGEMDDPPDRPAQFSRLVQSGGVQVKEQHGLQDDEQRQSHHEVPFPRLVPEQPHRDHAAYGPTQQRKPQKP